MVGSVVGEVEGRVSLAKIAPDIPGLFGFKEAVVMHSILHRPQKDRRNSLLAHMVGIQRCGGDIVENQGADSNSAW